MQSSPPPIEPEGIFDGIRWSAVLAGALVDIGVSFLASIPLLLWFAGTDVFADDPEVARAALDAALDSPGFLAASFVTGFAATVYGAYFGARRAGCYQLRHGGWVAMASALLGCVALVAEGPGMGPALFPWYDALGLAVVLPAGLLGGAIALKRSAS